MAKLELIMNGSDRFLVEMQNEPLSFEKGQAFKEQMNNDPDFNAFVLGVVQAGFNAGKKAACDAMDAVTEKKRSGSALWNCPAANKVP